MKKTNELKLMWRASRDEGARRELIANYAGQKTAAVVFAVVAGLVMVLDLFLQFGGFPEALLLLIWAVGQYLCAHAQMRRYLKVGEARPDNEQVDGTRP